MGDQQDNGTVEYAVECATGPLIAKSTDGFYTRAWFAAHRESRPLCRCSLVQRTVSAWTPVDPKDSSE